MCKLNTTALDIVLGNDTLHASSVLGNNTLQALCCAGIVSDCIALCPNPDLAGIGVRLAFYLQSFINALLVIFSPTDSVVTAWTGTLLTLALVIAAIVSKVQDRLTLHHALLVLNFSTLSTISSLAVAPMLPIWRLSPAEYYERHRLQHGLLYLDEDENEEEGSHDAIINGLLQAAHKKQKKQAQTRERAILALLLLLQVVLQWAWGIYLFVSPSYSQSHCSGSTILILFMVSYDTASINDFDQGARFLLWPAWILFCLLLTLGLAAWLALVGSNLSTEVPSSSATLSSSTPVLRQWGGIVLDSLPSKVRPGNILAFMLSLCAFGLWAMYIAASEWQSEQNCVFSGENDFGGLGQVRTPDTCASGSSWITALFVAIAPVWSLAVALYRYPQLRRRRLRRRLTEDRRDDPEDQETAALLQPPTPPHDTHVFWPSDDTQVGGEVYEMRPVRAPLMPEPCAHPPLATAADRSPPHLPFPVPPGVRRGPSAISSTSSSMSASATNMSRRPRGPRASPTSPSQPRPPINPVFVQRPTI